MSERKYVNRNGYEHIEYTLYQIHDDVGDGVNRDGELIGGEFRYCVLRIPLFRNSSGEWLGQHQYMLVR